VKQGTVIKSTGSCFWVKNASGEVIECKIKGKFRTHGIRSTNPLAVGDVVDFEVEEKTDKGIITAIHDRRNYIVRKSINLSKQTHIIAANVDQAILMATLASPKTYTEFIDRFLVSAEAYQIPAKIIFNKVDIYGQEQLNELNLLKEMYEKIGYECFIISAKQSQGLDDISRLLEGKISVIAGHSGVGKSTLINILSPGSNLKTGMISIVHESGKHTTTYPEMIELSNNGYIIDTPGIKGFGVFDLKKEELTHFFPEMFAVLKDCQYYNCTHYHEPGCAVKGAVEQGNISKSRYNSYLNLLLDNENEKYRINNY